MMNRPAFEREASKRGKSRWLLRRLCVTGLAGFAIATILWGFGARLSSYERSDAPRVREADAGRRWLEPAAEFSTLEEMSRRAPVTARLNLQEIFSSWSGRSGRGVAQISDEWRDDVLITLPSRLRSPPP